jgi:hypothetical protein
MQLGSTIVGVGVFLVAGCGAGTNVRGAPTVQSETARTARATTAAGSSTALPETRAEPRRAADASRSNELATNAIEDRFAVQRQVTALERAIELYQTFIERAGDDPRYAEAVRRSRGRIEDARLTICFLLEKPCEGSETR